MRANAMAAGDRSPSQMYMPSSSIANAISLPLPPWAVHAAFAASMILPSSMRFSEDVSIGDWPCFAEKTTVVVASSPCRFSW